MKNYIPIAVFVLALFTGVGLSHRNPQNTAPAPSEGLSPLLGVSEVLAKTPEIEPELPYAVRMDAWLDILEGYENCPSHGIVDSNSEKSYGALCYQKSTYLLFMRIHASECMPFAEEVEWLNNLSDRHTQRCLARLVIENNHAEWRNWWTSIEIRGCPKPPKLPI